MSGRRWTRVAAIGPLVLLAVLGTRLTAQSPDVRLRRAADELESLRVESARDSMLAILDTEGPVPDSTLIRAHTLLGVIHLALGNPDSARSHFAAVVERDPLARLDPETYNPELIDLFDQARSTTPAIVTLIEPPLTVHPLTESLSVRLAVGMAGTAEVALHAGPDQTGPVVSRSAGPLGRDSVFTLSLALSGDSAIDPGRYTLQTLYTARSGDSRTTTLVLDITRGAVDTLVHLPQPDSTAFRPEFRKGGPPLSSLVTGVVVGTAAAALPVLLWNGEMGSAEMRTGAIAVGGSITIAGIVGMMVGRPDVPVQPNIRYNEGLLVSWRSDNQRITDQNEQRRRAAPLSITVVRER